MCVNWTDGNNACSSGKFDFEVTVRLINDLRLKMELERSIDRGCFNMTAVPCRVCSHKMHLGDGPMGEAVYVCEHVMAELRRQLPPAPAFNPHRIGILNSLNGLAIIVECPEPDD